MDNEDGYQYHTNYVFFLCATDDLITLTIGLGPLWIRRKVSLAKSQRLKSEKLNRTNQHRKEKIDRGYRSESRRAPWIEAPNEVLWLVVLSQKQKRDGGILMYESHTSTKFISRKNEESFVVNKPTTKRERINETKQRWDGVLKMRRSLEDEARWYPEDEARRYPEDEGRSVSWRRGKTLKTRQNGMLYLRPFCLQGEVNWCYQPIHIRGKASILDDPWRSSRILLYDQLPKPHWSYSRQFEDQLRFEELEYQSTW